MVERKPDGIDIPQALTSIHQTADLLLTGRKIALEAMKEPPYYPQDPEEFATRIWSESGVDFWSFSGKQREKIASYTEFMFTKIIARAEYQQKWNGSPKIIRLNHVMAIRRDLDIDLDQDDIDLAWGIFSYAIIAKRKAFQQIGSELGAKDKSGFVGKVFGDLGPIPVIMAGKDVKTTLHHEDLHVLQAFQGDLINPFDHREALDNPAIDRLLGYEEITPSDLTFGRDFFSGMIENTKHDIEVESRAYAWDGEPPIGNILDSRSNNSLHLALQIKHNLVYAPVNNVPDSERIRETYDSILNIVKLNRNRNMLWAITKKAARNYQGDNNRWEWAASRLMVLPLGTSLNATKTVLLGKDVDVDNPPKLDVAIPLPQALAVHARRTLMPDSFGKGDIVPTGRVDEFIQLVTNIYTDANLYSRICSDYGISDKDMAQVKQQLIKYAAKSTPHGYRGKTKRELSKSLTKLGG